MDINRIGLTIYRSKLVIEGNCEIKVIEIINIRDVIFPFGTKGRNVRCNIFPFGTIGKNMSEQTAVTINSR